MGAAPICWRFLSKLKVLGKKDIHIAAGMFNRPVKLKTIMSIFIKGKLEYYKLDHHIPKFKRYPKKAK